MALLIHMNSFDLRRKLDEVQDQMNECSDWENKNPKSRSREYDILIQMKDYLLELIDLRQGEEEIVFPPKEKDGFFAKDKYGILHQFAWSFDNKLFLNQNGKAVRVDKNKYEIVQQ